MAVSPVGGMKKPEAAKTNSGNFDDDIPFR
jgi:hypothetical protein